MVFAIEDSPVYMMGAFDSMAAQMENQSKVQQAFKRGAASPGAIRRDACSARPRGSSAQATRTISCRTGCRRWTAWWRSSSKAAMVADVGCGYGWSTVLMAQAFPNSQFVGFDFHEGSIEQARTPKEQELPTAPASRSPRRRSSRARATTW